jgi:hypothetical protein
MIQVGRLAIVGAILAALGWTSEAQGQVVQRFTDWSGKLDVTVANNQGEKVNLQYQRCTYTATDAAGKVIRTDRCWYFPNPYDESKGLTATCNRWVYWLKVDPENQEKDVVWARCPTPHHPKYKELQKELKGPDLWQIIPIGDRKPKQPIHDLAEKFGKTIAAAPGSPPFVSPETKVTINCIDFTKEVFR